MTDRIISNPICVDPVHADAGTDVDILQVPPLDSDFLEQYIHDFSFDEDFTLDDLDFSSDMEDFFNLTSCPDSNFITQAVSEHEISQPSGDLSFVDDRVSDFIQTESVQVCDFEFPDAAKVSNFPSLESGNLNQDGSRFSSSQGSGNNCCSNESESLKYKFTDSADCAPSHPSSDSVNSVIGDVDKAIAVEESGKNCLFKRKKENEDVTSEPRKRKHRNSNGDRSYDSDPKNEDEEKKKARLIRNRESAHLSRQRKKHYVEELEDKLRKMHSAVNDLNSKISYIMAENASLKQQLGSAGTYPHPPVAPMAYPWVPYMPYYMNPQTQVPLLPIPKLPTQPVLAPKAKKVQSKKTEGKTKKVASISILGLLFFILLFGGLVPKVNMKSRDYMKNKYYDVKGHLNGTRDELVIGYSSERLGHGKEFTNSFCGRGQVGTGPESNIEFSGAGNTSEPLFASLYVRRNDTMVKIDGNLIIHSAMATEKAMVAAHDNKEISKSKETGLVLAANMVPDISIQGVVGRNFQRALGGSKGSGDNWKSTTAEGELQKWFHDGLSGPMLSSGMCSEVFQFDVLPSPRSIIIPTTSAKNISTGNPKRNSNKGRNRRILHNLPPIPLPQSSINLTKEGFVGKEENTHQKSNNSRPSMVVSVLVDPRETTSNSDGFDGSKGKKSLSRVFVVLLLDGVKYVTYSCVIPRAGSTTTSLVTA